MFKKYFLILMVVIASSIASVGASEIRSTKVSQDLSKMNIPEETWKQAPSETLTLFAQPMVVPKPKTTTTHSLQVQAIHNGQWVAFRLKWKDTEKSEAGILGKYSDAVALQFPVKVGPLPPIFMGMKDQPVHIFHWRAQYQRDQEKGKPEIKDLYPNMNPDMYPMEFKDSGHIQGLDAQKREVYAQGKAAGNPQSYQKTSAVDEIIAEGFGSSSVIQNKNSVGHGNWEKGEWSVVIARPLKLEDGSTLQEGKENSIAFAVWQGGKDEVGSRKALTMSWVPLTILKGDSK